MEEKINIAEILKDKPNGIRLYSPIFGECAFLYIQNTTDDICVKKHNNEKAFFNSEGLYNTLGECLLFPSKKMRDWRKFTWKRGDVLVSNDSDSHIIFEGFSKDDYTTFEGKHWISVSKKRHISYLEMQKTQIYHIKDDKDAAQTYINTIEEKLGGKLNLETLEVDKQPEFKDGDILSVPSTALPKKHIFIFSKFNKYKDFEHHVALTASGEITIPTSHGAWCRKDSGVKYATEEEKQQLFEALANVGKAWDAEKKAVVDLKPKVELKPFDKVLVKDNPYGSWEPALFWKKVDVKDLHPYMIIGGKRYRYCEPYEGNEDLLDN